MSLPVLDRVLPTQAFRTQAPSVSGLRTPTPQEVGSVDQIVSLQASTWPCSFFQLVMDFFASIFQAIDHFFKPIFDFFSEKTPTGSGKPIVSSEDIPAEIYRDLTVNAAKICEVPDPIDLESIGAIARMATPPIKIDELLTQFDRIYDRAGVDVNQVIYKSRGWKVTRAMARTFLEHNYLELVRRGLTNGNKYSHLIADEIDIALKEIILELRAPANETEEDLIIITKKKDAIQNLCRASHECEGRRHMEALAVFHDLSKQWASLENIVKLDVQRTKEALFLNYYSLSCQSSHMLNYIRRSVGAKLGLDISEANLRDPYIHLGWALAISPENRAHPHNQPDQFLAVFDRIYTPSNILPIMKNFLNERIARNTEFAAELSRFINDQIEVHKNAGELVSADTADMPMPYQNDYDQADPYHLTDAGVKFIMVHFGILNSATPNGHLVRAAVSQSA